MGIKLEGMDELLRQIDKLGSKAEQTKNKALEEAGDFLKERIKANVPVRTGNLQKNIVRSEVKDGKVEVGASPDGFYGYFLEFGFFNKRVKRRIPPRPFVGPAFEANKKAIRDKMATVIKRGLGL
jgi:HK97 gp10 family phage protein